MCLFNHIELRDGIFLKFSLRLVVGDKVRIGKVKEKKQARKDFNRAKSEKKSTALVE